jgi:hypothetical protein
LISRRGLNWKEHVLDFLERKKCQGNGGAMEGQRKEGGKQGLAPQKVKPNTLRVVGARLQARSQSELVSTCLKDWLPRYLSKLTR